MNMPNAIVQSPSSNPLFRNGRGIRLLPNKRSGRVLSLRSGVAGQRGFTLVELMISIVLGLLIVAALLALYVSTSRTNNEMARTNSLIDRGRFATQLLENDIVHAGFWGTHVPEFDDQTLTSAPGDVPDAVPDPCWNYTTEDPSSPAYWTAAHRNNLIGIPLQTYDAASVCTGVVTDKLAATDLVVVRHAETCVPGVGNCEANITGKLYFQGSLCASDAVPYLLGLSGHALLQRDCSTLADIRKFVSTLYYVRNFAVAAGDGIPTLMRSRFECDLNPSTGGCKSLSASHPLAHHVAVPLIEGIEGFRVELGIDSLSKTGAAVDYTAAVNWADATNKTTPTNRGDGAPESFVRCTTASPCTAAQLTNVTAVKLHVLVRNREPTQGYTDDKTYALGSTTLGPFDDQFKRHVFSTTVRLHNVGSRRESP
jgi:type IV pilus assembly protein PilW